MSQALYNLEKHREALLWSFLVAKSDIDGSDYYSRPERQRMLAGLGGRLVDNVLKIKPTYKAKPSTSRVSLQEAGLARAVGTRYAHTSFDGYPVIHGPRARPRHSTFKQPRACSMSLQNCFGTADFFTSPGRVSIDDTFKRLTFQHPECGDCLITALLSNSDYTGLEAFLPSRSLRKPRTLRSRKAADENVPYIGGNATYWREADFSFKTAIGNDWKPRDFAVRLIQRYSYVIGEQLDSKLSHASLSSGYRRIIASGMVVE